MSGAPKEAAADQTIGRRFISVRGIFPN